MNHLRFVAHFDQTIIDRFSYHNRAMTTSGAPHAYGQIALSFALKPGKKKREQIHETRDSIFDLALRLQVLHDRRIASGQWSKLGDEVRVWKKSHVKHHIQTAGRPVPETKRGDGNRQLVSSALFREPILDHIPKRVNCVLGSVDHVIRDIPNLCQQLAFLIYCLQYILIGKRMRSARFTVSTQQHIVVRFQKENRDIYVSLLKLPVHSWKEIEEFARADVDYKCDPIDVIRIVTQLDECRNQLRGKVIYREVAKVFKVLQCRGHS